MGLVGRAKPRLFIVVCLYVVPMKPGFYREPTPAMVQKLYSETNIPLGVDDPDTRGAFSKVVADLYGGAKKGTISRGVSRPISTVVISSNFPTMDQQRYVHMLIM